MKKMTIDQIRQEAKIRLDHLKRLLKSCETRDQLNTVEDYRYELRRQLDIIICNNTPFFCGEYLKEMRILKLYFDDEYRETYDQVSKKIFNSIMK